MSSRRKLHRPHPMGSENYRAKDRKKKPESPSWTGKEPFPG